jgi:hypothetical protein
MEWVAVHRKAITAAAVGALTVATYFLGSQNQWVVLGGAILGVLGVNFVPNRPAPTATAATAAPPPPPPPPVKTA